MNISPTENIWLYLHDNKQIVGNNQYISNRYFYLTKLLEFLRLHKECLPELKLRMYMERINDSEVFLQARNGYGKTEYRIIKLMQIKPLGENLKQYFPDLVENEISNTFQPKQ